MSPTSIFAPVSTPAESILGLSVFVFSTVAGIFVVVFALLGYAVVRFRSQHSSSTEPAQIYGSTQVELAWTVIPVLIVVALFLATARVIRGPFRISRGPKTRSRSSSLGISIGGNTAIHASISLRRMNCMCRSAIGRIRRPRS